MRSVSSLVFLLPLAVSAIRLSTAGLSCDVDPVVVSALQEDDAVISYCSSYLSVPTVTYTDSATETPASVYTTLLTTITGDVVTTTETATETTSTDSTTMETITETSSTTTTIVSTTVTLSCLDSAYTASAPTVNDQPIRQKREVDTTCSHSSTAAAYAVSKKSTQTIVVYATTTVCPCTETSSKAPCSESSLHGSASSSAPFVVHTTSKASSSPGTATPIPFTSSRSYSVSGNSTVAPSGSLVSGTYYVSSSATSASSYVSSYLPSGTSYASSSLSTTSLAVSNACSCLSIPTASTTTTITQTLEPGTITDYSTATSIPTITSTTATTLTTTNTITENPVTTTTTTLTAYATATTIASNGAAYRKYTHDYDANLIDSGFTSTYFKNLSPDWSGSLQSLSFSTPDWPSGSTYLTLADGTAAFDASQAAIFLQGFFIAQETGVYTLSSSADDIDNWGYLWTGDAAYSAWDDSNTAFQASRTGAGYYGGATTLVMNAGDAVPITWLWANGGGVAQSYFAISAPDGSYVTDSTGYFVQACSAGTFA